ncbi:ATP-binding protein [Streptomyces sp. NPDC014889]|uniref:ATP-binding protein n=1 Tax=Streptomyces sp. NPDC014889 TaxID=3364928 RepID=UPI0036FD2805
MPASSGSWSANGTLPTAREASPEDESGRGLALVETLANDWGAEPRQGGIGKTVWFELARDPHAQTEM